jgi:hypothetical protein
MANPIFLSQEVIINGFSDKKENKRSISDLFKFEKLGNLT